MNVFNRYLAKRNDKNPNILPLPAQALDHLLAKFFKRITKKYSAVPSL